MLPDTPQSAQIWREVVACRLWQLQAVKPSPLPRSIAADLDASFLSTWLHIDADSAAKLADGDKAGNGGSAPQPAPAAQQGAAGGKDSAAKDGEGPRAGYAIELSRCRDGSWAAVGEVGSLASERHRELGRQLGARTSRRLPCLCPSRLPLSAGLPASFLASWLHIDAEAAAKLAGRAGAAAAGAAQQPAAAVQAQAAPQAATKTGAIGMTACGGSECVGRR